MTTPTRARTVRVGAASVAAALALPLMAGSASANSFSRDIYQGTYSYNDGKDRFCLRADEVNIRDRAVLDVKLTPYDTSRGPTISFGDIDSAGATCRSLAGAYEDTRYKAVVRSLLDFDRGNGSTYVTRTYSFYS